MWRVFIFRVFSKSSQHEIVHQRANMCSHDAQPSGNNAIKTNGTASTTVIYCCMLSPRLWFKYAPLSCSSKSHGLPGGRCPSVDMFFFSPLFVFLANEKPPFSAPVIISSLVIRLPSAQLCRDGGVCSLLLALEMLFRTTKLVQTSTQHHERVFVDSESSRFSREILCVQVHVKYLCRALFCLHRCWRCSPSYFIFSAILSVLYYSTV